LTPRCSRTSPGVRSPAPHGGSMLYVLVAALYVTSDARPEPPPPVRPVVGTPYVPPPARTPVGTCAGGSCTGAAGATVSGYGCVRGYSTSFPKIPTAGCSVGGTSVAQRPLRPFLRWRR
jgi:hypothetical protein